MRSTWMTCGVLGVSLLLQACGGGSDRSPLAGSSAYSVSGQAQKGPLIFGSLIWVSELDTHLDPTGKTYLAETTDDLGNFAVSGNIASPLVQLVGQGYYMDELTGSLSSAPITLTAIADLSVDTSPTINILTSLAAPRVKNLIRAGKSYSEALSQAQSEVLQAFNINAARVNGLQALYAMQLNGSTDQDSVLLATSAVLSQMSTDAALGGSSQAAQMSYFLSRIAADIADDGVLSNASIISARNTASSRVNLAGVRTNVETYYANRGLTMTAPKFEEWIDKSNSGTLPQRLIPASGLSFASATAEINSVVTSNAVTVSGLGGVTAQAYITGTSTAGSSSAHSDWKIIKNNTVVNGTYTVVSDGDTLAMRLTADSFGATVTPSLTVGSTTASWQVETRRPRIVYVNQNKSNTGQCNLNSGAANYFAMPFVLTSASTVNYLGVGVGASSAPDAMAIHADNSGVPGAALVTTNTVSAGGYFMDSDTGFQRGDGSAHTGGFSYPQAQVSSTAGTQLQANTQYWIVLRYNNGGTPICNFSSGANPTPNRTLKSSDGSNWSNWTMYTQDMPGIFLAN